MGEGRELLFRYRNGGDDRVTPRRVQPWHLVACDHRWYLVGYNIHQHQVRTYALSRMSEPRILDNHFVKPLDFDPNEHFKDCLGVMKRDGSQTYEVVVELDRYGTDLVSNRRWHSSQQLIPLPNGCSRLIVRLGCLDEIERAILSWGVHATVIGPEPLRQRLARIAADLTAKYGPPAETVNGLDEHQQRFQWQ
jgi:predicted DNA-binding transcriptional regulator YafY